MLVYRLEHRTLKTGPWQSTRFVCAEEDGVEVVEALHRAHDVVSNMTREWVFEGTVTHPNIWIDFNSTSRQELGNEQDLFCAVLSLDEIFHWFDSAMTRLREYNFIVRAYDIPDDDFIVGYSGKQVLYIRDREVLHEEIEL